MIPVILFLKLVAYKFLHLGSNLIIIDIYTLDGKRRICATERFHEARQNPLARSLYVLGNPVAGLRKSWESLLVVFLVGFVNVSAMQNFWLDNLLVLRICNITAALERPHDFVFLRFCQSIERQGFILCLALRFEHFQRGWRLLCSRLDYASLLLLRQCATRHHVDCPLIQSKLRVGRLPCASVDFAVCSSSQLIV